MAPSGVAPRSVSIHAPVQGGDEWQRPHRCRCPVSIHAPVQGGDITCSTHFARLTVSIHAPVQGGDFGHFCHTASFFVSIHAPVQGGDRSRPLPPMPVPCFNPRPRARGRLCARYQARALRSFQSTPPCKGATGPPVTVAGDPVVSIHAPVQGGDSHRRRLRHRLDVSIHAPVQGGDPSGRVTGIETGMFQSTPPCKGATWPG